MDTQVHKNVCMCSVTQSCLTLCHLRDCSSLGSSIHWDFSGKNIGMSCHFPLQGIFSTQGSNSCLLRLLHWQAENKNFEPYNSHRCGSSLQTKHESKCFLFIIFFLCAYLFIGNIAKDAKHIFIKTWGVLVHYGSFSNFLRWKLWSLVCLSSFLTFAFWV